MQVDYVLKMKCQCIIYFRCVLICPFPLNPYYMGQASKTVPNLPPHKSPPNIQKNAISWKFLDFNTSIMFHMDTKGLALLCVHICHLAGGPLAPQAPQKG